MTIRNTELTKLCYGHTCSIWFSGLNVKVARFSQHLKDVLLKEREQPANIFPTQTNQEGQIRANQQGQQDFETPI